MRPLACVAPLIQAPYSRRRQAERNELVYAVDHFGLAVLGYDLAVGNRAGVLVPGLLGCVVRIAGGLPGFQALQETPSARSRMRRPSWLMSSTIPSATRKSAGLLGPRVENVSSCSVGWLRLRDLLGLAPLGQREGLRPAALVLSGTASRSRPCCVGHSAQIQRTCRSGSGPPIGTSRTAVGGISRGAGRRTSTCSPARMPGSPRACRGWRATSSRPRPRRRTAPSSEPSAPAHRPTAPRTPLGP